MLDHVILTVADFMRSTRFYERALRPLGITDFLDFPGENGHPHLKGFGANGRYFFWLKQGDPDRTQFTSDSPPRARPR
jgi:catechol 2,3-dioxygenase-like lactoylglutathione lyase family enzyme